MEQNNSMDLLIQAASGLIKQGMEASIVETKTDALKLVNELIEAKAMVRDGGSQTLLQCGIVDSLLARDLDYISHNQNHSASEKAKYTRESFDADYFLMSANAITMHGELINIDGNGNRVAALIFGPKKVIVIAGYNKIVEDEKQAIERIGTIASPLNCERLDRKTPCRSLKRCMDCYSEDRICSAYVKINFCKNKRIHVILVNESLGY